MIVLERKVAVLFTGLCYLPISKNGYLYVYVSNETPNINVFFDNLQVTHIHGPLLQEQSYYPFGLRIDGISSKKFDGGLEGSLKNNNLYNDKELWDDADLDWYDYGFRNYDPQIGRFVQLDPLTWDYPELTNYQYASNEPIANVDMDGLERLPTVGGWWNGSFLEQGAKTFTSPLLRPIVTNIAKVGSNIGNNVVQRSIAEKIATGTDTRYADQLIEQAFKKGKYVKPFGMLVTLLLTPTQMGEELSPREAYERFKNPYPGHGNKNENWDPHDIYEFSFSPRDGKTPIIKYGIYDAIKDPKEP